MNDSPEKRIYNFVTRANWVILLLLAAGAGAFFPIAVFLGVLAGGLIVTVNFSLLRRTLGRALNPEQLSGPRSVLVRYYIRFVVSGVLIAGLIVTRLVDPVGLLVGLSVVVASIASALVFELTHNVCKEAS